MRKCYGLHRHVIAILILLHLCYDLVGVISFFVNREKEHGFLSRVVTERVVVIYGSWWVGMCIVHTFSFPAVHFIIDVCSGLYYKNEFGDDFSVLF